MEKSEKYISGIDVAEEGSSSMGVELCAFPHSTLGEVEYLSIEEAIEKYGDRISNSQLNCLKNKLKQKDGTTGKRD